MFITPTYFYHTFSCRNMENLSHQHLLLSLETMVGAREVEEEQEFQFVAPFFSLVAVECTIEMRIETFYYI